MSTPLTIIRQRRHNRQKRRESASQRTRRVVQVLGFIASALAVISVMGATLFYISLRDGLPPVEQVPTLLNSQNGLLLQPTRLFDRTGEHVLATLSPGEGPRLYALLNQIPPSLLNATIAIAEPNFRSSPGFVIKGWQNPASHPTLAQRLVSDLLLWDQPPSVIRALHERILAAQVTATYTRAQVLEWYLNSANFGHYAFGVEAAAQLYLDKSVTQITLSEAALLSAISQVPALNPIDAPSEAEQGRIRVLETMLAQELISPGDAAQAILEKPSIASSAGIAPDDGSAAPAFVRMVLSQLDQDFANNRVERGGMVILTSLDFDLQVQSTCIIQTQLGQLSGDPAPEQEDCPGSQYLPAGEDMHLNEAVASALIIDPQTGQVLAAVGDSQGDQQGDILTVHPAGTSITPFIYLTGFSRGLSPASLGWDIPGGTPSLGQTYHGPVSLRTALANDYMQPALSVIDQMGAESITAIASPLGIEFPQGLDLLQQDFDISPLTLAGSYGIFANSGILAGGESKNGTLRPVTVLKVRNVDGTLLADWSTPQERFVVSPQLAYLMNHVLSDDTARWPSLGHTNPLMINRPAAAKLSHSLDLSSAWTVGYTPQRVVVAWLGAQGSGTSTSLPSADLWHALMENSLAALPEITWDKPGGIVNVTVCDPSGMLPTSACPNTVPEVFLEGNQPIQSDTLFQTFQVNIETGLLATVFTPPDLVEQWVFMVVPPQARAWAVSAGIPSPPTAYDTVEEPKPLENTHISSPAMFTYKRGALQIRGTAAGMDFVSYRLEFGQGLYPITWTQIGTDSTSPVTENTLGEWDSTGLNGLYALRLMVVRSGQKLDQSVVQVTIDNTPPQVAISYPIDGQTISFSHEPQMALQAQVNEPFVDKVEFFINNISVGKSDEAPYGVLWPSQVGRYTLRVVAADLAGNTSEATLQFLVK
jgi:membrane peptidoglycan carboxypeptidase